MCWSYGLGTAVAARGVGVSGTSGVRAVAVAGSIFTAGPDTAVSADGPEGQGPSGSMGVAGPACLIRSGVQYSPADCACCSGTVEETTPISLRGAAGEAGPATTVTALPKAKSARSALDPSEVALIAPFLSCPVHECCAQECSCVAVLLVRGRARQSSRIFLPTLLTRSAPGSGRGQMRVHAAVVPTSPLLKRVGCARRCIGRAPRCRNTGRRGCSAWWSTGSCSAR